MVAGQACLATVEPLGFLVFLVSQALAYLDLAARLDLVASQAIAAHQAFLASLATVEPLAFQAQASQALADSAAIQALRDSPVSLDSAAFQATQACQALADFQVTQVLMA
jgi:hypothetical protein